MTTNAITPLAEARAQRDAHLASLARWEDEAATAAAELADLQERAGEELAADPTAQVRISDELARLRSAAELATRAADAVRPQLAEAERVALLVEADTWDDAAATAQVALDAHRVKVDALLAQLQDLDGAVYERTRGRSTTGALLDDVRRAETMAGAIREWAAGNNPLLALYPEADRQLSDSLHGRRVEAYRPEEWAVPEVPEPPKVAKASHVEQLFPVR